MNNLLLSITCGLVVLFSILMIVIFLKFKAAIEELKSMRDTALNVAKVDHQDVMEQLAVQERIYNNMYDLLEVYGKKFDAIADAYDIMRQQYKLIGDHYRDLLNVWGEIDDRYDATYEQFKCCIDKLNDISNPVEEKVVKASIEKYLIQFDYIEPDTNKRRHSVAVLCHYNDFLVQDWDWLERYCQLHIGNELNKRDVQYKDIDLLSVSRPLLADGNEPGDCIYISNFLEENDSHEPADISKGE